MEYRMQRGPVPSSLLYSYVLYSLTSVYNWNHANR